MGHPPREARLSRWDTHPGQDGTPTPNGKSRWDESRSRDGTPTLAFEITSERMAKMGHPPHSQDGTPTPNGKSRWDTHSKEVDMGHPLQLAIWDTHSGVRDRAPGRRLRWDTHSGFDSGVGDTRDGISISFRTIKISSRWKFEENEMPHPRRPSGTPIPTQSGVGHPLRRRRLRSAYAECIAAAACVPPAPAFLRQPASRLC